MCRTQHEQRISRLRVVIRSCRLGLWPLICGNTMGMGLYSGATILAAGALGGTLCFLASYGFILNDLCDRRVDKLNCKGRLEHADLTTLYTAASVAAVMILCAFGMCGFVDSAALLTTTVLAIGLTFYSLIFRRLIMVSTLLSATLSTSPLWVPATLWRGGDQSFQWNLIGGLFCLVISREVVFDIRDRRGDLAGRRNTYATVFGDRISTSLVSIMTVTGLLLLARAILTNTLSAPVAFIVSEWLVYFAIAVIFASATIRVGSGNDRDFTRFVFATRVCMALIVVLPILERTVRV